MSAKLPDLAEIRAEKLRRERQRLEQNAERIRERCRTLVGFIKEAWHVLEPMAPYVYCWHHTAISEHLEAITRGEITRLQINQPPGTMKEIAHSTPICTPRGWRTHGDLLVGDQVFGPDGEPTEVIGVSAEDKFADYEITFSTRETIKCHGDHLWRVCDRWATDINAWKVVNTRWLAEQSGPADRNRFFIPDTWCLQFPHRDDLPLHPYFLGCWLGDGSSISPIITHDVNDAEHIEKLKRLGYRVERSRAGNGATVISAFTHQDINAKLRNLNIFGNKRIPEAYLLSSKEQRLELLAGLVDTDGCLVKDTHKVKITTCDPALADDYQKLIVSLGFRPHLTLYDAPGYGEYKSDKTVFVIGFQPDGPIPTAIPRKTATRFDFARRKRAITGIKKSSSPESARCITVARPDGLYVVGRTNLVTHNSLIASVLWEAWEWGPAGLPGLRYLTTSYTETYARRDARKMRDLVLSEWYQTLWPSVVLTRDNEMDFENTAKGGRRAMPFASLTAGRGNRVVLDDPHSVSTVESDTEREHAVRLFRESVTSRLNDPAHDAILVIMHRLHPKDVCGEIERLGLDYVKLVLPMEYEPKSIVHSPFYEDPRTGEMELLCPERVPREIVEQNKMELGSHAYNTQFQQHASAREGGMFKRHWFKIVDAVPADVTATVRRWDLAASEDEGDWTVGLRMSMTGGRSVQLPAVAPVRPGGDYRPAGARTIGGQFYVEDVVRLREGGARMRAAIQTIASQDGSACNIVVPQDPGQAGKDQASSIIGENAGYRISAERETGKKETRAEPFAAQCEAGNIYLLRGPWNEAFIDELCEFPNGRADDQVDAASGAFNKLVAVPPPMVITQQMVQKVLMSGRKRRF